MKTHNAERSGGTSAGVTCYDLLILEINMQEDQPDSWRVKSARFCGTHTTDKDVADYWIAQGEAYPLYKRPELPKARGVIVDHESPGKTGVLIIFERQLTNAELTRLHSLLSA